MEPLAGKLAEVLVYGTFSFGVFMFLVACLLTWEVKEDRGDWAAVTLFAVAAFYAIFGNVNVFRYVYENPWESLKVFGEYTAIGYVIVAPLRFLILLINKKNALQDLKIKFLKSKGVNSAKVPDELIPDWAKCMVNNDWDPKNPAPQVLNHKLDYMRWGWLWPFTLTWIVFNDLIQNIGRACFQAIQRHLQTFSNYWFKDEVVALPKEAVAASAEAPVNKK